MINLDIKKIAAEANVEVVGFFSMWMVGSPIPTSSVLAKFKIFLWLKILRSFLDFLPASGGGLTKSKISFIQKNWGIQIFNTGAGGFQSDLKCDKLYKDKTI